MLEISHLKRLQKDRQHPSPDGKYLPGLEKNVPDNPRIQNKPDTRLAVNKVRQQLRLYEVQKSREETLNKNDVFQPSLILDRHVNSFTIYSKYTL